MRRLTPTWVVLALTAGLLALPPTSPAAADAPWCGSACNGKSPSASVTLLNGAVVKCINSAVRVSGPWYPTDYYSVPLVRDIYQYADHMYSNSCQTTWLRITNTKVQGRSSCSAYERRTVTPTYQANSGCANVGTSVNTPMVNDHDDAGRLINVGHLTEVLNGVTYYVDISPY